LVDGFFRSRCGALPAYGRFRANNIDFFGEAGDLEIGGLVIKDVYVYQAEEVLPGLWDVVFVDKRVQWWKPCDKNYNMYKPDRIPDGDDYKTEADYTWQEVIQDLLQQVGEDVDVEVSLQYRPRNILALGRPIYDVLDEVMYSLGLALVVDMEGNVKVKEMGGGHIPDGLPVVRGGEVRVNEVCGYGARVGKDGSPWIRTQGDGKLIWSKAAVKGEALQKVAADMRMRRGGYKVKLAGIWDLIKLGFVDVTWTITERGAFTQGQDWADLRKVEVPNGLFNYGSFVLPPRCFPVKVVKDDGENGDGNNPCTFKYTVKSLDGDILGQNMTPERRRTNGVVKDPGTEEHIGIAYYKDGQLHLLDANEVPDTTTCE